MPRPLAGLQKASARLGRRTLTHLRGPVPAVQATRAQAAVCASQDDMAAAATGHTWLPQAQTDHSQTLACTAAGIRARGGLHQGLVTHTEPLCHTSAWYGSMGEGLSRSGTPARATRGEPLHHACFGAHRTSSHPGRHAGRPRATRHFATPVVFPSCMVLSRTREAKHPDSSPGSFAHYQCSTIAYEHSRRRAHQYQDQIEDEADHVASLHGRAATASASPGRQHELLL